MEADIGTFCVIAVGAQGSTGRAPSSPQPPPTLLPHNLRWDFWTVHGAEELSGINSSPARAAGEVEGKT